MTVSEFAALLDACCDLCLAAAVVGCIVMLIESAYVLDFRGESTDLPATQPPVTILKPLHGPEPGLADRLEGFCEQDYDGPVQIVIGAQKDADATDTARAIKARLPDKAIDVAIDPRNHGSNHKVSNIINMMSRARHDVVVLSDSDIVVGPDYLHRVVALLASSRVGVVTCLYYGIGDGLWSRLSAIAINSHFLPGAIMAAKLRLAQHCCGATIATRRSVLERIGGFSAVADALADDYELGAAVQALGYEIVTAPFLVAHRCLEGNLRQFFWHQLRVARTIRAIEPIGYAGTVLTHPWPLALLGMLSGNSAAVLVAVAALASRLALCRCVERRFGLPRQNYWLVPLHDVIVFAVYVASFFGTTVHWRASDYHVTANGTLVEHRGSET